jgi:hypothetical protein
MADPHVISALREKRAMIAGLIEKLERKLEQHRADLTHIDGVLRLFQPDRDPGEIKPKRTYARRTRYFARNELSRLVMDALRTADGKLVTTDEIAGPDCRSEVIRRGGRSSAQGDWRAGSCPHAIAQKARHGRTDRIRARPALEAGERGLAPRPPFRYLESATNSRAK